MRIILVILVIESVKFCTGEPELTITNCVKTLEEAEKVAVPQSSSYFAVVKMQKQKGTKFKYDFEWNLENMDTKQKFAVKHPPNKMEEITVEPFSLPTGKYEFVVKVIEKNQQDEVVETYNHYCYLKIGSTIPKALISGGSSRVVPSFNEISLDGSQSMDMTPKSVESKPLKFSWTCTQKSADQKYCQNGKSIISTTDQLRIPSKFAIAGEKFEITLTVSTWDDVQAENSQTITVEDNAIVLTISCHKNCPPSAPFTISKSSTLLYASCQSNCAALKDEDYEWSVKSNAKFDFKSNTDFGKTGRKFAAKSEVLKPGKHEIEVKLKPPLVGAVVYTLQVEKKIAGKKCQIEPKSGVSLKTEFKLKCSYYSDLGYNLQLWGGKYLEGGLVFTGSISDSQSKSFFLPSGSNFDIKISKPTGAYLVETLSASVKSSMNTKDTNSVLNAINETYYGTNTSESLVELLRGHNKEKALQKLEGLVEDLVQVSSEDPEVVKGIKKLKHAVIEDLLGTSLNTQEEINKALKSVSTLVGLQDKKTDPELARIASVFCKKLAEKQLALILSEPFPITLSDDIKSVTKSLSECTASNTNPNEELTKPVESVGDFVNLTAPGPLIPMDGAIVENYANYEDFDDAYFEGIENLAESTKNIFKTSGVAAKTVAMTTGIGEKVVEHEGPKGNHKMMVAKDLGVFLVKMNLTGHGVTVKPSMDLNREHPFDILMSVWDKDLMWWNPGKVRVMTDVLSLEFWHSTCKDRVNTFQNPVDIYLDIKQRYINNYSEPIFEQYPVPVSSRMKISERYGEIRIRRMNLMKNQAVLINFSNLSRPIDVVLVVMRQPMIEDFARKTLIINETTLFYLNKGEFDVWVYLAVLPAGMDLHPNKDATEISYNLNVVTPSCVVWVPANSSWNASNCTPGDGSTMNRIHCQCYDLKLSTLGGLSKDLDTSLQELFEIEIRLEMIVTYVVFVWISLATLLFALLLLYLMRKSYENIYFLADNTKKDLFAYLVIVKTENVRNAGTTSNISIRLFGEKGQSKSHVLNYPDPHKRMLQKNSEDWFVLTTHSYLGKVLMIKLWTDSIGMSPAWHCRHVLVYDLQKKHEWLFKIGAKLTVSNDLVQITASSDSKYLIKGSFLRKLNWNENHTWFLGRTKDNLLYIQRISIIYSTFLFTGAFSLILFGLPTLTLGDCFDRSLFFAPRLEFYLVTFGTSLISFGVHTGLAWIFRLSQPQFPKYPIKTRFSYKITRILWGILVGLIVISASILLVFGWWLPINLAWMWLTCCVVAILVQVLIYEYLVVLVRNFLFRREWKLHIGEKFACIIEIVEQQRIYLYDTFGNVLLRPYFKHLYAPMSPDDVKVKKILEANRKIVIDQVQDLVMFSIYMLMLYMVILMEKDPFMVTSNKEMTDIVEGRHSRTIGFNNIKSRSDMFDYMYHTLIPSMQSGAWYWSYYSIDPGLMKDFSNKYLGVARMRQLRLRHDAFITLHNYIDFLEDTSEPEITWDSTETRRFSRSWGNRSLLMKRDRLHHMWKYSSASATGAPMTLGVVATYPGGGYVMPLGRTLYNSYANLRVSFKYAWIDNRTRGTFIEFLAYNANYNMFNAVKLMVEHSASGFTHTTIQIRTARMLYVQNEAEKFTLATFGLFICWVFFLTVRKSVGLVKNFRTVYKDVWFMVDMVILLLSLVCISLVAVRIRMLGNFMAILERSKHNIFVNYFNLFNVEDALSAFSAFLVCVATVRLWRFLRFILAFRIMERTLALAAVPLLHLLLCHVLLLICFATSGIFLFGTHNEGFMDLWNTLTTILQLSMNLYKSFNFSQFMREDLSGLYFVSTSIAMYVLNFLYVTTIVLAYAQAQLDFSSEVETFTIKDYAKERVKYYPIWCKVKVERLKGGQSEEEESSPVTPKDDEFRYAKSVQTSRFNMKMMEYLVQGLIHNRGKSEIRKRNTLNQKDEEIMSKIVHLILKQDEFKEDKEFFFIGHSGKRGIVLVDERRIIRIEKATNLILMQSRRESSDSIAKKEVDTKIAECSKVIKTNLRVLQSCEVRLKLILAKLDTVNL